MRILMRKFCTSRGERFFYTLRGMGFVDLVHVGADAEEDAKNMEEDRNNVVDPGETGYFMWVHIYVKGFAVLGSQL